MSAARYVLAGVTAAALATGACTAASGADRVTPESAPAVAGEAAPAVGLLPRVDAGASALSVAVDDAIAATRTERDRAAAAEKAAAEKEAAPKAQEQAAPALSCEPDAGARLVGNIIVNKNCPELTALKEQSQRDYLHQLQSQQVSPNAGTKPSEAEQRRRIANGIGSVGSGYEPGSTNYKICEANPVADVCGG